MFDIEVIAQVNISISEEQLKQLVMEKIKEQRPDLVDIDVKFTGSRTKGKNINIDIKATLGGASEPTPRVSKQLEEVVEKQVKATHKEVPKKKVVQEEEQVDIEAMIAGVEAAEETDEQRNARLIDEVLVEEEDPFVEEIHDDEPEAPKKKQSLADLLS